MSALSVSFLPISRTSTKERPMVRQTAERTLHQEQTDLSQEEHDALLTVNEVARRLRVDATTVRRWIAMGILEVVILPHYGKRQSYRIQQRTLEQLLSGSNMTKSH
jgi:excisionase family DNA binding protein